MTGTVDQGRENTALLYQAVSQVSLQRVAGVLGGRFPQDISDAASPRETDAKKDATRASQREQNPRSGSHRRSNEGRRP